MIIQKRLSLCAMLICLTIGSACHAQKTSSFTDPRDGKKYKTVKLGEKTWMAQDLNFVSEEGTWCYDEGSDCTRRLYNWKAATEGCPTGWHLPSEGEWLQVIESAGGERVAGIKLKAVKGWDPFEPGSTNASGFSALPGGYRNHGAVFGGKGTEGYWWSSTEQGGGARYFSIRYDTPEVKNYGSNHKGGGFSVRCVGD